MKIALIGYGKMGKEIEKIALSRGHEIVSIIDVNNQEDFNSDAFKSADVAFPPATEAISSRSDPLGKLLRAYRRSPPPPPRNDYRNS